VTARPASKRSVATQRRRARVVTAVLDLHRRGGTEAVTLARVRKATGVSTGSIYHQFGDRDGLLDAAFESLAQEYRAFVSARVARDGRSASRYVRALVAAHLEWVFEHPDEARAMFRTRRALSPERAVEVRRSTGAFVGELLRGLHAVAKPREIVPMTSAIAAAVVLGPAHELARQWLAGRLPELDRARAVATLADAAWRSVARR